MAYEELKAQIREYIKPNEQEEITGAIMQAILLEMVNQLGAEGSYLPLTGGNVTGGIVVSSDLSSPSHEALRLNQSGISVEKIASVGLNEILNVTANSITYSSYFPSETPNTLTISLGYTGVTLSGGVTAASFINSSVDASIRYQYLLKADGNVISISDIGGTDMQTVWEALAAATNEQINVSHLSTALNGYIRPTISNLSNGDILVYDSVGTWVNTSMSSFLSGYATETWVTTQLASYATQSWVSNNYLNKVSTNSGDIYINDGGSAWVLANLNTLIVGYGYITASALNGYATEAWVGQQGYLTSSALNGYIHPTLTNLANGDILVYDSVGAWVNTPMSSFLAGYATKTWVGQQGYITSSALNGYATQSWVTSQGYIQPTLSNLANGDVLIYDSVGTWVNTNLNTTISGFGYITSSALSGYATETWVTNQGYITSSALNGYIHPTLTNLADGNILVYDAQLGNWVNTSWPLTGYATQSWVNTQLAGYLPLTGGTMTGKIYNFENRIIQWTYEENDNNSWGTSWYGLGRYFETQGSLYIGVLAISNYWGINLIAKSNSSVFVNGNAIITSANIGFQSVNYATSAGSANILGHTVYENQAHSLANGDMLVYDSGTGWTNVEPSSILSGYATQSWVTSQGYLTSSALAGYIHPTLTNLANGDILVYDSVGAWYNTSLSSFGFATQTWVGQQGYITSSGSCAYAAIAGYVGSGSIGWADDFVISGALNDVWSDGTNTHPWYGYDHRHPNTGVFSTTISDYFGITLKTAYCNISMTMYTVGIDTYNPQYKLDVNGSANATTLYENGSRVITTANIGSQSVNYATSAGSANILGHSVTLNSAHSLSNGDILVYDSAGTWTNVSSGLSDIRQKNVIKYEAEPLFETVANAPAIRFTYKDNTYSFRRGIHVGSIAQYWQTTLPETVSMDNDGMLSMQYDVIALLSTISVAKKVSEHERRIILLERENEQLKKEIQALKSA